MSDIDNRLIYLEADNANLRDEIAELQERAAELSKEITLLQEVCVKLGATTELLIQAFKILAGEDENES